MLYPGNFYRLRIADVLICARLSSLHSPPSLTLKSSRFMNFPSFSQLTAGSLALLCMSSILACSSPAPTSAASPPPTPVAPVVSAQTSRVGPTQKQIMVVIDQGKPDMKDCYLVGTFKNAQLTGQVSVNFTIETSGLVSGAVDAGSNIPDKEVVDCVIDVFAALEFPSGGISATDVEGYSINFGG